MIEIIKEYSFGFILLYDMVKEKDYHDQSSCLNSNFPPVICRIHLLNRARWILWKRKPNKKRS